MAQSKHILLDSNVWRYIVDSDGLPHLQRAARSSHHKVVVAPAVLYEAAHSGDPETRGRLLTAMALPLWKRLMPEAYLEAEEVKAEVRRLRPDWLRQTPDLAAAIRARHDWARRRGGIWDRIKQDAELVQRFDSAVMAQARQQARELRAEAKDWPASWRETPLTEIRLTPTFHITGCKATSFEPWRFDALNVFRSAISTPGHASVDWLEGEVDLELTLFQLGSLTRFWLQDTETLKMPRHWLRWAFEFLQQQHRVTDGTPVDAQIGTHLVDADIMLSADKVFVRIANRIRADAPFALAESRLIPAGNAALATVLDTLEGA